MGYSVLKELLSGVDKTDEVFEDFKVDAIFWYAWPPASCSSMRGR